MTTPLKIGTVALGRIPRVVAVCAQSEPRAQVMPIAGVDLWEARVDLWITDSLARVRRQIGLLRATLPVIVTIRGKAEGGQSTSHATGRAKQYEELLDLADAIDVEASQKPAVKKLRALCDAQRKTLIVSYHDFDRTPPVRTLQAKVRAAEDMGADAVKIATMLHTNADILRLAEVQSSHPRHNLATMGMGRTATLSRLLLAGLGSILVYGAFERIVAPGQVNVAELTGLMKLVPHDTESSSARSGLSKAA